jgi:hypothetical protein
MIPSLNQNFKFGGSFCGEPGTEYEEDKISRPHDALSSSHGTFRMASLSSFVSERLGCNIVTIDEDILCAIFISLLVIDRSFEI